PPAEEDKGKSESKVEAPTATKKTALPAGQRITLMQAVQLCLQADPKLKAGVEGIAQAQAEFVTASLKPNPELGVSQTLMPLFPGFTVDNRGGPPQLDVGVSYPIDWCLFGKRAAAMASAQHGVEVSEHEYADLLRLRVGEVVLAYYDVLE